MKDDNIIAVIVAGGSGVRLDKDVPKQYFFLDNRTILEHTIIKFFSSGYFSKILVVVNPAHEQWYVSVLERYPSVVLVYGGDERWQSVKNAVYAAKDFVPNKILIHDANRPFISHDIIKQIIQALEKHRVVIAAEKVYDTVKIVDQNYVVKTIDRTNLVRVQTPQGFYYQDLLDSYGNQKDECLYTDEASLMENNNHKIFIINSSSDNFKITDRFDLERAKKMLSKEIRTGIGFDAHRFDNDAGDDHYIILGGVKIKHKYKILAHSDGDVLIHALVDALLGAIGMGDIGLHFPPSDDQWKGADSAIFLEKACEFIKVKNGNIINVDITIICESPRISLYRDKIKESVAGILKVNCNRVNIKGTTTEKMGFTGRKEGVAVQAVANVALYTEEY